MGEWDGMADRVDQVREPNGKVSGTAHEKNMGTGPADIVDQVRELKSESGQDTSWKEQA